MQLFVHFICFCALFTLSLYIQYNYSLSKFKQMEQIVDNQIKTDAKRKIEDILRPYYRFRNYADDDIQENINLKLSMAMMDEPFNQYHRDSAIKEMVQAMKEYGMRYSVCIQTIADFTGYSNNSVMAFASTHQRTYTTIKILLISKT